MRGPTVKAPTRRRSPLFGGLALIAGVGVIVALAVISAPSTTSYRDLRVGDCFMLDGPGALIGVDVIECDVALTDATPQRPAATIVSIEFLNDSEREFPGESRVDAEMASLCGSLTDVRIGLPVAPTEQSWTSDRGRGLCLALSGGG